jgi:LysR family glycine cleavage system transcriptional activator
VQPEHPIDIITETLNQSAAGDVRLGFALARWALVTRSLHKGSLRLASKEALPFSSAYHFVCPQAYLELPKVAQFREWLVAAARDFRGPAQ